MEESVLKGWTTMTEKLNRAILQQTDVSGFAYELLRGEVLANILGDEIGPILYWEGKNLARRYPLNTTDEIVQFFYGAGWGMLEIIKNKDLEIEFELTSDLITYRNHEKMDATYQLEAGFLAQQFEQQKQCITECYEQNKKRSNKIIFTVKSDGKDIIDSDNLFEE